MVPRPLSPVLQSSSLTRRHFLSLVAGTVVVAACSDATSENSADGEPARQSSDFNEPETLFSTNGQLDVSLTAGAATYEGAIDGALAYNDAPIGPTLRVRPGDRINLTLRNGLDAPTNLHTHGLNVSPAGRGDDVFATIAAGDERSYVYVPLR